MVMKNCWRYETFSICRSKAKQLQHTHTHLDRYQYHLFIIGDVMVSSSCQYPLHIACTVCTPSPIHRKKIIKSFTFSLKHPHIEACPFSLSVRLFPRNSLVFAHFHGIIYFFRLLIWCCCYCCGCCGCVFHKMCPHILCVDL